MARRVTPKTYKEQQTSQSSGRSYPKFSDIIVNLSVTNLEVGEDKSVRLRLVGLPITYKEYNDKKWVPGQKGKTERVPFPDAHLNKSLTRIGHDDESQCPWKAEGYIASAKYAQNVLEYDAENKTWFQRFSTRGHQFLISSSNGPMVALRNTKTSTKTKQRILLLTLV